MKRTAAGLASLRVKIILVITLLTLVIFGTSAAILLVRISADTEAKTVRYMETLSREYANIAKSIIETPLASIEAGTSLVASYRSIPAPIRRQVFTEFLRSFSLDHPEYFAVWMMCEPEALGDDDSLYLGRTDLGSNELGMFNPYFYWEDGELILDITDELEEYEEDYYTIPRDSNETYVSEPYDYSLNGEDVFMVSLVTPIRTGDDFVGVFGIDIVPQLFHERLDGLVLYESGYGRLISNSGTVVTHPDSGAVGVSAVEWPGEGQTVPEWLAALYRGEISSFFDPGDGARDAAMKTFIPVYFGTSGTPWFYSTQVPREEYLAESRSLFSLNLLTLIAGTILTVIVTSVLSASILNPLKRARDALKNVAEGEGDLTQRLRIVSNDEVGQLSRYFDTFSDKLSRLIGEIRSDLESLRLGSAELKTAMEHSSQAVAEINENIGRVDAQIREQGNEILEASSTVERIIERISALGARIGDQNESLVSSSAAVEEMVANIRSVTVNVDSNTEHLMALEKTADSGNALLEEVTGYLREIAHQSDGLEETNTIIQNISSQTNLLAMNAAIEAAHAGDSGRGFAVVADEIRKLAEDSAGQSQMIGRVLKSLKDLIDRVVRSMTDTGASFEEIRTSIRAVTKRQQEIRSAMDEQTAGSRSVLDSIGTLNGISGEVTAEARDVEDFSLTIRSEMNRLVAITDEISGRMTQMSRSTGEIHEAAAKVAALSDRYQTEVERAETASKRFKIT